MERLTEKHISISQLSVKCSQCKDKDNCNEKRMEACACIIPNVTQDISPNIKPITDIEICDIEICIDHIAAENIQKSIQQKIISNMGICDKFLR